MACMWSIEVKKTEHVEFTKPLRKFIVDNYPQKPEDYEESLTAIDGLRQSIRTPEFHESGLNVLKRYFGQLSYLQSRFPVNEDQVRIKFPWSDAVTGKSVSHYSLNYEKACVLFNLAAVQVKIALQQNLSTDDGLKTACKYYQAAAGVFSFLEEHIETYFDKVPTEDMSKKAFRTYTAICLAQAQECFWSKAKLGKMKDSIVAKLAAHTADLYDEAYSALTVDNVKGYAAKQWGPMLQVKRMFFMAVSQYHQSIVAHENDAY
eukprot:Nk52_evm1s569 gene=Nk52_evmTU1s569